MSEDGTGSKLGTIGLWLITIVFGGAMFVAGGLKFFAAEMWLSMFEAWGYPGPVSFVVGGLEMIGAAASFVPRYATYGATLVAIIMVVAAITVVAHPGEFTPTVPLVNVVVFTIIAVARRDARWRP